MADYACRVDYIDYTYAIQFQWIASHYKKQPKLLYFRRTENRATVYLHRVIMQRTGISQPSRKHILVDHIDGNTLNCQRENLRWATPQMNRHNYFGYYHKQLKLSLGWQP